MAHEVGFHARYWMAKQIYKNIKIEVNNTILGETCREGNVMAKHQVPIHKVYNAGGDANVVAIHQSAENVEEQTSESDEP